MSARENEQPKLGIIGFDRAIINKLLKAMHNTGRREGDFTPIYETRRGGRFDVLLAEGRVARVTVELDRVEESS